MSTRSLIARPTDGGLTGVYHHYDGYPSGLGQSLWHAIHEGADVETFRKQLIDDHPGGWATWPHRCFCHSDRPDHEPMISTCRCLVGDSSGCSPLFLEWVYAIGDEALDVLASVQVHRGVEVVGAGREYDPGYNHLLVARIPYDLPDEPKWDEISAMRSQPVRHLLDVQNRILGRQPRAAFEAIGQVWI